MSFKPESLGDAPRQAGPCSFCGQQSNDRGLKVDEMADNTSPDGRHLRKIQQNVKMFIKYERREFCDTEQIDKINKVSPLPPPRSHSDSLNSLNREPEFAQRGEG